MLLSYAVPCPAAAAVAAVAAAACQAREQGETLGERRQRWRQCLGPPHGPPMTPWTEDDDGLAGDQSNTSSYETREQEYQWQWQSSQTARAEWPAWAGWDWLKTA